jgi:tetratricopeptide (TPR) repeat protein
MTSTVTKTAELADPPSGAAFGKPALEVASNALSRPWVAGLLFLAGLVAAGLVYSVGLGGPLVLDDMPTLSGLLDGRLLAARGWEGFLFSDALLGRPVSMATFIFNAVTSGDDVAAWKRFNVIIHLLNALAVFWLSAELWCWRRSRPTEGGWFAGLAVGLVWLLHPLHVSTVLYTVQRMTELSALFVFAGLASYVAARKQQLRGGSGYLPLGSCFLLCLPLAALSKENGVLLVPLALVMEVFLFGFEGPKRVRWALCSVFIVFLLIPALVAVAFVTWVRPEFFVQTYSARDFMLAERLLTEPRILFLYLQQLFVPIQRTMGFFHDDIAISHGWLTPVTTALSVAGLGSLAVFAWWVRRRAPLVALGIVFFFVGHALESTALALELAVEHRNYLPSYGVLLAATAGFNQLVVSRSARTVVLVLAVAPLALLTLARAQTWSTEAGLYAYAYRVHPQSDRATAMWAELLTRAGRYRQALRVLGPRPGPGPELQKVYIRCRLTGRAADSVLERIGESLPVTINHYVTSGLMTVGDLGLPGPAHCVLSHTIYAHVLARALSRTIGDPNERQGIGMYHAHYLKSLGAEDEAIEALHTAFAARPGNPVPLFLATEWLAQRKLLADAEREFHKAVRVARDSRFSYDALIASVRGKLEAAKQDADQAP